MTDATQTDVTDPESTDDRSTVGDTRSLPGGTDVRTLLAWGALAVCSLLALVALIQFYSSASVAIELWVAPRYEPIVQAAFNLVILLGSIVGISLLVRELS